MEYLCVYIYTHIYNMYVGICCIKYICSAHIHYLRIRILFEHILWKDATEQIDLVKVSQHSSCSLNQNMLPSLSLTFVKSLQVTINMMGLKSKTAHIWNIYPCINPVTSKHQSTYYHPLLGFLVYLKILDAGCHHWLSMSKLSGDARLQMLHSIFEQWRHGKIIQNWHDFALLILLMAEILHHLGCMKPCK